MPSLGLGLYLGASNLTTGVSYDPAATALFARFTTPPTTARKALINDLIVSLKTGGVWAKLDALHIMAAADAQAARRNWKTDQFNLTAISSPTFTVDRGYTGDGVSSYLSTGLVPSTAGGNFSASAAALGVYSLTAAASPGTANYEIGTTPVGANRADIRVRRSDDNMAGYVVDGTYSAGACTDGRGLFSAIRAGSTKSLRRNKASVFSGTVAATALPSDAITYLAAAGSNHSARQLAAAYIGALSIAEVDILQDALTPYLQAVGAIT